MASHRQKKEKKKSRKHKHKNRDRSTAKRKEKRNGGKKENIPHNEVTWSTSLRDVSNLIENPREMIREIFSSVGQEFLVTEVPRILQATRDELKKICLEELRRMSKEVIVKIIEGISTDNEPINSTVQSSRPKENEVESLENLQGQTSGSLTCTLRRESEESQEPILSVNVDEGDRGIEECAEGSNDQETSSSEESPSEMEGDESESPEEMCSSSRVEEPSTSCQKTTDIKLAKVAPFSIRVKAVEELNSLSASSVGASPSNNEGGDTGSYDLVDLGLEQDYDSTEMERMERGNNVSVNDGPVLSEEEMIQSMSEVRELEHRARAIRSMLANLDRFQS